VIGLNALGAKPTASTNTLSKKPTACITDHTVAGTLLWQTTQKKGPNAPCHTHLTTLATPVLCPCHTLAVPVLCLCCTLATPVSHPCHTHLTPCYALCPFYTPITITSHISCTYHVPIPHLAPCLDMFCPQEQYHSYLQAMQPHFTSTLQSSTKNLNMSPLPQDTSAFMCLPLIKDETTSNVSTSPITTNHSSDNTQMTTVPHTSLS
jgi:hypothetical protein